MYTICEHVHMTCIIVVNVSRSHKFYIMYTWYHIHVDVYMIVSDTYHVYMIWQSWHWFKVDIHFFYITYHITWFDNQNMILVPGSNEVYHVQMISYSCTCQHDSFRYILCVHHSSFLTWTLFQVDINFCSMWIEKLYHVLKIIMYTWWGIILSKGIFLWCEDTLPNVDESDESTGQTESIVFKTKIVSVNPDSYIDSDRQGPSNPKSNRSCNSKL